MSLSHVRERVRRFDYVVQEDSLRLRGEKILIDFRCHSLILSHLPRIELDFHDVRLRIVARATHCPAAYWCSFHKIPSAFSSDARPPRQPCSVRSYPRHADTARKSLDAIL